MGPGAAFDNRSRAYSGRASAVGRRIGTERNRLPSRATGCYTGTVADETRTQGQRFRTGDAATLGVAHFLHDIFSAFLAPLLPLLIERLRLSLFQAGALDFLTRVPSILNPLIGRLIDRGGLARWLVIVTPTATGTAMCLMGLAPSYAALAVLLLASGISIAAFHVAAPVIAAEVSGSRVGRGMGFFMVGGELARTAGPLIAVQAVAWLTLEGLWKMTPVCVAASALLWWRLRRIPVSSRPASPLGLVALWRRMSRVLAAVTGIMVTRAFMAAALTTFLPTFLYGRGETLWLSSIALSVFELGGALGVFVAGTISDRLGRRRVLTGIVATAPLLMVAFVLAPGALVLPTLALLGFVQLATTPVMMAEVIEAAGEDRAAANGTFMMISFPVRAAVGLAVGALGDALGLEATCYVCAGIAALGLPCALLLPIGDRRDGPAV